MTGYLQTGRRTSIAYATSIFACQIFARFFRHITTHTQTSFCQVNVLSLHVHLELPHQVATRGAGYASSARAFLFADTLQSYVANAVVHGHGLSETAGPQYSVGPPFAFRTLSKQQTDTSNGAVAGRLGDRARVRGGRVNFQNRGPFPDRRVGKKIHIPKLEHDMPGRPRQPLKMAKITGQASRRPGRYAGRKEPFVDQLGAPPDWLTKQEQEIWATIASEIPWLGKSDRTILELACRLRARIRNDPNMGINAIAQLRMCLSSMGATPVDRSKVSTSDDYEDEFFN